MEPNNNDAPRKIKMKVSELMKKFKHREVQYNFCRQKGTYIFFIIN